MERGHASYGHGTEATRRNKRIKSPSGEISPSVYHTPQSGLSYTTIQSVTPHGSVSSTALQEHLNFTTEFEVEELYGGRLLGVKSGDFVCFYDWHKAQYASLIKFLHASVIQPDTLH